MDTPALYFLFPYAGDFIRFCACKVRPSVDSFPFAFPRVVLNAQFVHLLHSQASFLCMLTSYLQRLALATIRDMHREQP